MSTLDAEYLTVAEAASLLRVSAATMRRWIRQGDVPAYRIGPKRVALKRDDLTALIRPASPAITTGSPLSGDKEVKIRKLTPEEKEQALAAMERARKRADEIQARRGGKLFPPAWKDLAKIRDERTRQLS